jgi:fatty acid desaturase
MAERTSFDIDKFLEASGAVVLGDIRWEEVPRHRLTPAAVRTLHAFLHTESATYFYLRALMRTRATVDHPEIAPFLCAWSYEEEFHGRAIRRFLEAYGERIDQGYRIRMFQKRGPWERIEELGQRTIAALAPEAFPAVHMVWGAVQELTTLSAYRQLLGRTDHPVLAVICQRIMKQEARHFAFYFQRAREELAASRFARRVTSGSLRFAWTPVGDGMLDKPDVLHGIRFLFDGMEGDVIPAIEARVRELPGLEWFDLFSRFVARHQLRRAPASWLAQPRRSASEQHAEVS